MGSPSSHSARSTRYSSLATTIRWRFPRTAAWSGRTQRQRVSHNSEHSTRPGVFAKEAASAVALVVNDGPSRQPALLLTAVFVLWTVRSLRAVWTEPRNVSWAVSGLLAGIVWVDLLAVADEPHLIGAQFIVLFLLAVLFQRFVPAT